MPGGAAAARGRSSHAPLPGLVRARVPDDLHPHPGGLWGLHLLLRARTAGSPQVADAEADHGARPAEDADDSGQPGLRGARGLTRCPRGARSGHRQDSPSGWQEAGGGGMTACAPSPRLVQATSSGLSTCS